MTDSLSNPYEPPKDSPSVAPHNRRSPHAPALLGTALTFIAALGMWCIIVSIFDRLVPRRFDMWLWSISLICSLILPAYLFARTNRYRPRYLHLLLGSALSVAAYAWLEGRAPSAGGQSHSILFYTTAIAVPVSLLSTVRLTPPANHSTQAGG